jgi:hypothetical protein
LKEMDHYFKMKPGSIGEPDLLFGCQVTSDAVAKWSPRLGHERE